MKKNKRRNRQEKPLWNWSGKCPSCGSKEYWPVYGGSCGRSCAYCGEMYDCDEDWNWLKRSGWVEEK